MTEYVLTPPITPSVAVDGESARFAVRRIFCVGRNYAAHAREMGKDPDREPPFFFTKPADAVIDTGAVIPYPPETRNLHYEIELVVAIGKEAFDADLIWPVPDIISILSRSLRLMPGDLIMTGTPAGVGPLVTGDVVTGGIDRLGEIKIEIGGAVSARS